jgi:hypothetical protein
LASTVTGPISDLAGLSFNPRVEFWPLSTPYNSGNTNVVGPMKSVQAVGGNFSQVLLAGTYRVKFPPTTNFFIIIVPNDNATYSLSTLSSNVASVSSITSTYFITSNQFKTALTNNDTRNVTFLGTVASSGFQGDGNGLTELDADNLIYGSIPIGRISDGLITSNKLDAAAYVAFKNDVTQSGLAAGSVAVNGVAVTNQFSMIGLLQNMPRGLNKATGVYGGTQVTNSQNLVIAATGVSGIVRTLFIHPDVGSTGYLETNMNKLKLLVYADGNLTCDVYLSDLWGTTFQTGTNWSINRYTRYCDAMADGLSLRTGFPLYTMSLRVPMPFTNGITCKLTNYTTGTTWTHGYIAAEYETLTLPTELLHARTYITNIHGSISASASNILFGVSGKGEVIGVNIGLSNSISSEILGFQDSHGLGFVLDTYIYKPDGLDDWLNRTYGGAQGASIGYDVGTLDYSYDYAGSGAAPGYMESFRWLYSDALRFTNSISVYRDGQTSIDYGYFTFFYIRKP